MPFIRIAIVLAGLLTFGLSCGSKDEPASKEANDPLGVYELDFEASRKGGALEAMARLFISGYDELDEAGKQKAQDDLGGMLRMNQLRIELKPKNRFQFDGVVLGRQLSGQGQCEIDGQVVTLIVDTPAEGEESNIPFEKALADLGKDTLTLRKNETFPVDIVLARKNQ